MNTEAYRLPKISSSKRYSIQKTLSDGDLFNIFRIIGEYFNKEFSRCLNPRYNLYISRINGKVNMEAVPLKDEAAAFYQFNNL